MSIINYIHICNKLWLEHFDEIILEVYDTHLVKVMTLEDAEPVDYICL